MKTNSLVRAAVALALGLGSYTVASAPHAGGVGTAAQVQAASPAEMVEFTVYLPLRHTEELDSLLASLHDPKSPEYQQWLQPSDFLKRFGPSASDLAAASAYLTSRGFTIVQSNAHGMRVQGPVSAVSSAFAAPIHSRIQNGRTHFMAKGGLQIPGELAALNARVLGLEPVPVRQVHSHPMGAVNAAVDNRYSA